MKIQQLQFDPKNANRGTERGRKALTESLKQYGAGRSILVDKKGRVIAGNKTLEQAIAAGHKDVLVVKTDGTKLVAVQRMDLDLKDKRAKALAIADNRVSELDLEWDEAVLEELGKEIDLSVFWSSGELEKLLGIPAGEAPEPQLDKAAELQKKWDTKLGQLWLIGPHRILCGDSTKKEDVARVMGSDLADLVWTDPPYGVDYVGGRNPESNVPRKKLAGDEQPITYADCLAATLSATKPTAPWYIWFAGSKGGAVYEAVESAGFTVRALMVWNKIDPHYGNFMAQYMQKHEPFLYCVRKSPKWYGPTNEVTVWDVKQPAINEHHPTEKPVELAIRAIRNSSKSDDIVCDWFLGSGTCAVAAQMEARSFRGIEEDPAYVAVALERLSDMGLKPKLA